VTASSKSNIDLYIGNGEYFRSKRSEKFIHEYSRIADGYFIKYPCAGIINSSLVFVNTGLIKSMTRKKHVLGEELTQAFGFGNES